MSTAKDKRNKRFNLSNHQYCLLGIASCLIATQIILVDRLGNPNLFASSFLFWSATGFLVWKKRYSLSLKSRTFPIGIGLFTLATVLVKSVSEPTEAVLSVMPLFSAIGLSLLASGFGGLIEFRREIVLLFFLGVPRVIVPSFVDISGITAKFSTYLLWYLGFTAQRQGVRIFLPQGGVEVDAECSGLGAMLYMLGVTVLFLIVFPLPGIKKKIGLLGIALVSAFIINSFRVVLMAILVNYGYQEAFHFLHGGQGSLVFSIVPVSIIGSLYFFLLRRESAKL